MTTPYPGNHPGEYRGVIRWATDMELRVIWTADPRPYAVNVVNQAVELGLADGKAFANLDFSERQADQLRPGASIVTCLPFVASDPEGGVQDFVARARAMSSDGLVTHVAFTHYNAMMALRAAIERSGDATAAGALAGFKGGLTLDTVTGPLMLEPGGYSTMQMFVATAEGANPDFSQGKRGGRFVSQPAGRACRDPGFRQAQPPKVLTAGRGGRGRDR